MGCESQPHPTLILEASFAPTHSHLSIKIIGDLEEDAPGLTLQSREELWECWREKVSRFLAFCLDGYVIPETLSLAVLADVSPSNFIDLPG